MDRPDRADGAPPAVATPPGVTALPRAAGRCARRVTQTARNVAEVVRFGGLQTNEQSSPYTLAATEATYRLRHYFPDDGSPTTAAAPAVLMVPPLMITAEVWDVAPSTSAVAALHRSGVDPWVVDFGDPGREPGGRDRTLADHVVAVDDAVERVAAATGRPVVLAGYSQGGMFVYLAAAYRRGADIDSLITFGAPVDITGPLPIPIAPDVVARLAAELADSGLLSHVSMPGWMANLIFKMLTPAKSVQDRVEFLLALHNRDALLPRERQRRFLKSEGWTAYSGPAIAELLEQFFAHNRMLDGGFVVDDRLVTLADIDRPVLTVLGTSDTIGHPDSVRAIRRAAPRAAVYEVALQTGHFGLVVGSKAEGVSWPAVAGWVAWRAGRADLPDTVIRAEDVAPTRTLRPGSAATAVAQAAELGVGVGRVVIGSAVRATRLARNVAREAPAQLPRLARIEHLDPATRISLGLLLDEQARRAPDGVAFLFGDRAYRRHDVRTRVDNVVKGLISIGVRHGDRVAVLMATRPSAFTVVAALSRLGATAVLIRPDGDVAREVRLGRAAWVISDPEHAGGVHTLDPGEVRWAVLGGGSAGRELDPAVLDMERIDPDAVDLPVWFVPDPHRAGDVAFVLFTGEGRATKALQITNRRWALSALGTASAAALRPGDTVYSVTPLHHSSALLMSIGGAVAGGARFALASADDPQTFWDEVRRYGATHVSYTWTSLRAVVAAAPHPNEQFHPIRMFIGSGMPPNLWRRVNERFPTARVLEFYASTEGGAILANLAGRAPGSMGKPLPGTAAVTVARFDLGTRRLVLGPSGLAHECPVDEVGLLLAEVDPADVIASPGFGALPVRGVFEAGDAWRSTGDLFLRDDRGDLWLAGGVADIVDTAAGPALPSGARFALGAIAAVDLVVVYGVPDDADPPRRLLVAALTVRAGADLTSADLDRAIRRLPPAHRPAYVQRVASIPLTTWHRPQSGAMQARGVPTPARGRPVWRLGSDATRYEPVG